MSTNKEVLDILEETSNVIEETLDTLEDVPAPALTSRGKMVIVGVLAFAVGAAVSYFFAKKRFEGIAKQEIAEAKEYYGRLSKPGTPTELAEALVEKRERDIVKGLIEPYVSDEVEQSRSRLEEVTGRNVEVQVPGATVTADTVNIFTSNEPEWNNFDYEEELANRSDERPYVITYDEFTDGEREYEQISLSYYEDDDTLTDDQDQPVPDPDAIVGNENLLRFGHASKDNNIVYVRNEELETDFEIVRNNHSYAQHILGFIEHSDDDRSPRKFRNYDD